MLESLREELDRLEQLVQDLMNKNDLSTREIDVSRMAARFLDRSSTVLIVGIEEDGGTLGPEQSR